MNTSAANQQNDPSDLNVLFEVGGKIFDKASISQFVFENELNVRPFGSFVLKDIGDLLSVGLESGSYGYIYFTNTGDDDTKKSMALPIYLLSVETIDKVGIFFYYRISFVAGNLDQMKIKTGDVFLNSNSVDALRKICEVSKSEVTPYSGSSIPTDTMNWILVHQDTWSQLDMVVKRSFLADDFIYWVWDDVNNSFVISSANTEKKKTTKHLLVKSMDTVNPTDRAKEIFESPERVMWRYGAYKKTNQLGSMYTRLFPNVSFLGTPSENIRSVGIRKKNFISLLKSIKDTKIDEILAITGLNQDEAVYGDLQLRKQNLNGHDLYSFADIYREYKIATYSKVFVCQITNSVGPSLGSFVTAINWENSSLGNFDLDKKFSDKYMVLKKKVEYLGKTTTKAGKPIDGKTNFITTLVLVSDNFGDGTDHINTVQNSLSK